MPAANTDLGYAVQNEYRQLLGLFWGSVKDTRAAISEIKCRPVGDVDIQGPPCFTNAMPKGPSQSQPFADCTNESCTATLEPRFPGERCRIRTSRYRSQSTTGFQCGSHRRSNGFICFYIHQTPGGRRDPGRSSPTHNGHYEITIRTSCQHHP